MREMLLATVLHHHDVITYTHHFCYECVVMNMTRSLSLFHDRMWILVISLFSLFMILDTNNVQSMYCNDESMLASVSIMHYLFSKRFK